MTIDSAYQAVIDAHVEQWPAWEGNRNPSTQPHGVDEMVARVSSPPGWVEAHAPTTEQALELLANNIAGSTDEDLLLDVEYARASNTRNAGQLQADQSAWTMENINAGRQPNDGGTDNPKPTQPDHPQGGPPGQRP